MAVPSGGGGESRCLAKMSFVSDKGCVAEGGCYSDQAKLYCLVSHNLLKREVILRRQHQ